MATSGGGCGFIGSTRKLQKCYEQSVDKNEANLLMWLRCHNHWKNLARVPLEVLPFLDAKVYPVVQALGKANLVQPESMVSYVETTKKDKWSIHHTAFE